MGMELPEFREADGRFDWRQMLDMVIPGDVYNSRTNQWRPVGMAAGAATMLGGPLAGAAVEGGAWLANNRPTMPNFSNPFSNMSNPFSGMSNPFAGRQRSVLPVRDPERYVTDTQHISDGAAGHTPGPWRNQQPLSPEAVASLERGMGASQPGHGTPMRGGQGGYGGQSISASRGLGQSQRRDADSIMADQMALLERMRGRNGALMQQ